MFEALIALSLCLMALIAGTFIAFNALEDTQQHVQYCETLTKA